MFPEMGAWVELTTQRIVKRILLVRLIRSQAPKRFYLMGKVQRLCGCGRECVFLLKI